uniref:Uncharacterized protein n=1 Tax=Anguilla anguilla TaxID=7936 RepID=A0A0E9PUX3_ANGAN
MFERVVEVGSPGL